MLKFVSGDHTKFVSMSDSIIIIVFEIRIVLETLLVRNISLWTVKFCKNDQNFVHSHEKSFFKCYEIAGASGGYK